MTWLATTLPGFKAWYGGAPPLDDAAATRALTIALGVVELYLDRYLDEAERTQEFWPDEGGTILLRAWPVSALASVTSQGQALDVSLLWLDRKTGRLGLGAPIGPAAVVYTGGFNPMPVDLELALWSVAAAVAPGASSAADAASGAPVRRVTTPDVGTIEYAASSGGGVDRLLGAQLAPQIEATLYRYRAESVVGVG